MIATPAPAAAGPLAALRRLPELVVLLAWALASLQLIGLARDYSANMAVLDDLVPIRAVTGAESLSLPWLFAAQNEHRLPLARLLYAASIATTGSFRTIQVGNAVLLSLTALVLILAAARLRGRASYTDVALVLLALHPGHAENLFYNLTVTFVLTGLAAALLVATITAHASPPSGARAHVLGATLQLLPLLGAPGVVLAPSVALWALLQSRARRGMPGSPALAAWASGAIVLALAMALATPASSTGSATLAGTLRTLSEFLSVGLGPAIRQSWPAAAAPVLLALVATIALLAHALWRNLPERTRASGLLGLLAGQVLIGLAIGYGRSHYGPGQGQAPRYAALSMAWLAAAYLASVIYRPGWIGSLGRAALLAATAAAFGTNADVGMDHARKRRTDVLDLEVAIAGGTPLRETAERVRGTIYPDPAVLTDALELLRREQLGPFDPRNPTLTERSRALYPMLRATVVGTKPGLLPLLVRRVERGNVLVVHAPGEVILAVHAHQRRIAGRFGIVPEAYNAVDPPGAPPNDGVHFSVALQTSAGRVPLFARHLDPRHLPADRESHQFEATWPSGTEGSLVLATDFGPPGTPASGHGDWGYWTDVVVE